MTTNHHNNRWAAQKAKEIGNTVETQTQTQTRTRTLKNERRDPSPARSDSSNSDFSVSSLVQKWRGFEAEAEARHNHSTPTAATTAVVNDSDMSRDSSLVSTTESTVTSATTVDEGGEREEVAVKERETEEEEREREKERERERERIRVADIVRKWPGDEQGVVCLARLRIGKDSKGDGETRTFSPCLVSPRIRGRQAIADLFMSMERERYKEVELLESRHAVSKFPQRGRIQSLLKLRFLRRELTVEEQQRPPLPSGVVGSSRCQTSSAITCLREKFKTSADQDSINQKSASKETSNSSNQETQNDSTSKHTSEQASCQHEPKIRSSLTVSKRNDHETESAATAKQPINQASDQEHLNIGSSLITRTMDNNDEEKTVSTLNQPSEQISRDEELNIAGHLNNKEATERVLTMNQDSEQRLDSHCEQSNTVTEQCVREEEESHQNPLTQVIEALQEETPSSEVMCQESSCEEDSVNIEETQEMVETATLYNDWEQEEDEEIVYEDQEESSQYYFEPNLDWISDIARPRSYWEDLRKTWYQEVFNTRSQDEEIRQLLERGSVSAVLSSDFRDRMDRLVMNNLQRAMHSSVEEQEEDRSMRAFFEQHLSSFNYVQERREEEQQDQEQVHEHREDDRQDQNRRQLFERGNVSAVLASDFRQRMDQLVLNHMQRAMSSSVVQEQDDDRSRREKRTEDVEQEQNMVEDEQENGELEDEREDESSTMHQYHDVSDYYDQNSSSSHLNWGHHDHEGSYDSDHAATSLQEPSPLTSYDCATHEGSSFKNASIEMELIYDLRSHMEQLYREMAELRKSITSCMDMQMKMQHTIREEVSAAIIRKDSNPKMADRVERKESNRKKPKKGTCCICYEKKVDSLLYRCGHMCTCFTCANELQWSSGKCPICRAQIIDVVRAYPHS